MKTIIICKEPFPCGMAATSRIQCYAKALMAGGVECRVVIFTRTEKGAHPRNPLAAGTFEGVPYIYVGGSTRKPGHKIPRLLAEAADRCALKRYLRRNLQKGDVVVGYVNADTDFMCRIIDLVHGKGAKYVRELCEIPFFGSDSPEAKKGLQEILGTLFPKCDGFLTISDSLTRLAEQHRAPEAKILKLPILVDYKKQETAHATAGDPYIIHIGTLYEQKDGILGMIRATALARQQSGRPLRLVCTGRPEESPDRDAILETVRSCGMEEAVEFRGYLDSAGCRKLLTGALTAILNKHDNPQNVNCFSTKLAEYLASGTPVILTDVGEALNWLKDGESALVVPRDDDNALAQAILRLLENPSEGTRIGEAGREVCRRNFDWRAVSGKLCNFIMEL